MPQKQKLSIEEKIEIIRDCLKGQTCVPIYGQKAF